MGKEGYNKKLHGECQHILKNENRILDEAENWKQRVWEYIPPDNFKWSYLSSPKEETTHFDRFFKEIKFCKLSAVIHRLSF